MLSKAMEMGVCFHKGLFLGNIGGRYFPRAFERSDKFLLSGEILWVIRETCKRKLRKRATLSLGVPFGEPGGVSYIGAF